MATDKPRFSVTFSDNTFSKIQNYKDENKISTQSKAVAQLVALALDQLEASGEIKKAPSLSEEALHLAKDYDWLDAWGKKAVREVADVELERMEDENRFLADTDALSEEKVINLFTDPSAAGPALGITGQGCEPYVLKPEDPKGAAYAVRVQGNSMEPDFPDGSIAFVNHDEMRDGDIGVFCVDGATVIKQWHYDPVLRMTYLFSLNRDRADADVLITSSSGLNLVWQGRVIAKRHYPLPGQ